MRYFLWFFCLPLACLSAGCVAFGVEPVTVADFGGTTLEAGAAEASPIWLILAGQGTWGAILFGILALVWKFARPYLVRWMEDKKLDRLYLAVEACVAQTQALYVDAMKERSADGKLTEAEKAEVFAMCKRSIISFMATQGVDVIKEYGDVVVDCLIEFLLSKLKVNNAMAKAVVAPLPDLQP